MNLKYKIKHIIDSVCWTKINSHPAFQYIHKRSEKPFENYIPKFENKTLNASFLDDNVKWFHNEFILEIQQPVIIEPDFGNVVIGLNKIVEQSIFYPQLTPSFLKYFINRFFTKTQEIDAALLLDVCVGDNYFHFFSDVINKLWIYEKYVQDKGLAVIVGEKIFNMEYFQYIIKFDSLKNIRWIVLERNNYLKSNHLYISRVMPYDLNHWAKTTALFNLKTNKQRRIFLTRSIESGRFLSNFEEIIPTLLKYNFEIIDTMGTSIEYQKDIFSESDFVIAVHGAGEANLMFSYKNNPKLIEIHPSNRIACHYYWLSIMFNIRYDCVVGGELKDSSFKRRGFSLDVNLLENSILKMLGITNYGGL